MSLGKMIYWIGVLSNFKNIFLGVGVLSFFLIFVISFFGFVEFQDVKFIIKHTKKLVIMLVISGTLFTFIPDKKEMYIIAFTKDLTLNQIYQMTKEEIKSSIDYFFEKIEEIKNKE